MKHPSFLLVSTLSLLLAACSKPEAPPEPIRAVKLMTVSASTVGAQQEYAGEVRARVESRLGFRVGGKLVQRPAEVGQRVQAGQLLDRPGQAPRQQVLVRRHPEAVAKHPRKVVFRQGTHPGQLPQANRLGQLAVDKLQ